MIKAHEIQGWPGAWRTASTVSDSITFCLVRVASTALATADARGFSRESDRRRAIPCMASMARHCGRIATRPMPGPRKSWAAGDATSRAVRLALLGAQGRDRLSQVRCPHRPGASTTWPSRARGSRSSGPTAYVMENVLFKISFPAEFHAQTAVEAAVHAASGESWAGIDECRADRAHHPRVGHPHHQQDRHAGQSRRIGTTACNT